MTSDEIAKMLDTFRLTYSPNQKITAEQAALWKEQFRHTDRDVMRLAVKDFMANEEFFPKPAKLREYVTKYTKVKQRTNPGKRCKVCDGSGWVKGADRKGQTFPDEKYDAVLPCKSCDLGKPIPEGQMAFVHDEWDKVWRHENNHLYYEDEETSEVHPDTAKGYAQELRMFLAETKNPDDL